MIRRTGMIIAWALATVAATGIAVAAVSNVADQVVEEPATVAVASSSNGGTATSTSGDATSSSQGRRGTSTSNGGTVTSTSNGGTATSTSNGGSVTSTSGDDDDDATSTSNGGTTSTSEAPPAEPTATATYNLVGGWVTIAYGPGVVELVGAAPNSGFSIEIKENGPDRVEVEFESDDHESRFRADETSSGTPDLEIEEGD